MMSDRASDARAAERSVTSAGGTLAQRAKNSLKLTASALGGPSSTTISCSAGRSSASCGDIIHSQEIRHRQKHLCSRRREDVGCLGRLETGVDRHQHAPGGIDAQRGDDPRSAVGGPDRTRSPGSTPDAMKAPAACCTRSAAGRTSSGVTVDEGFRVMPQLGGALHGRRNRRREWQPGILLGIRYSLSAHSRPIRRSSGTQSGERLSRKASQPSRASAP